MDAEKRDWLLKQHAGSMADIWLSFSSSVESLCEGHGTGLDALEKCAETCVAFLDQLTDCHQILLRRQPPFHVGRKLSHTPSSDPGQMYKALRRDLVDKVFGLLSQFYNQLNDLAAQGAIAKLVSLQEKNVYRISRVKQRRSPPRPLSSARDWTLVATFTRRKSEFEPVCPSWVKGLLDAIDENLAHCFQITHGVVMNGTHARAWTLTFLGLVLAFWTEEEVADEVQGQLETEQAERREEEERARREQARLSFEHVQGQLDALKEQYQCLAEETKWPRRLPWPLKLAGWLVWLLTNFYRGER